MANMTIRKKWYAKLQQISNIETRKEALWAILEYLSTGSECVINSFRTAGNECMSLMSMVIDDVEKSRMRAEAARQRRQEQKQNARNDVNQPRRSRQHIYEQHPAMYLFDGFASYLMSTAYKAGRKAIIGKYGNINFDKAIRMFRQQVVDKNTLGCIQRLNVFCDMFTRFISAKKSVLAVSA